MAKGKKEKGKTIKSREGNTQLCFWQIPSELKKKFKICCLKKDLNMQEAQISMMEKFIK